MTPREDCGLQQESAEPIVQGPAELALSLLEPGRLSLLGARSGRAASQIALRLARHWQRQHPGDVFFFDIAAPGRIRSMLQAMEQQERCPSKSRNRSPLLATHEVTRTEPLSLRVWECRFPESAGIVGCCTREIEAGRVPSMVVVDSVQSVCSDIPWEGQAIPREALRDLRALARGASIPVLVTSELSGFLDQRTDPRPLLSDFSDLGVFREPEDHVAALHERWRYRDHLRPDEFEIGEELAEIVVWHAGMFMPWSLPIKWRPGTGWM